MIELAEVIIRIKKEKPLVQKRKEIEKEKLSILSYLKSQMQ